MAGPRKSVCRSLFGPVDHDQLSRELELKLGELAEEDSRRWNFNFQTETPLAGSYQWDEMPADGAAAVRPECALPRRDGACSPARAGLSEREDRAGTDQENRPSVSNTGKRPAEGTAARRKRTLSKPAAKPGSNARITDFFAKRRRMTEARSFLNPFHSSSSEAALCKTLR
ncbi:cyclin dependent kinase inhibitor 1Ca [Clinocottus analis]|uniref:cyclin dependent kinase inhibitor 1Ca n=1 Tax=Clinocottus analis TaxID=304258 RepID=UPI0035BF12E2